MKQHLHQRGRKIIHEYIKRNAEKYAENQKGGQSGKEQTAHISKGLDTSPLYRSLDATYFEDIRQTESTHENMLTEIQNHLFAIQNLLNIDWAPELADGHPADKIPVYGYYFHNRNTGNNHVVTASDLPIGASETSWESELIIKTQAIAYRLADFVDAHCKNTVLIWEKDIQLSFTDGPTKQCIRIPTPYNANGHDECDVDSCVRWKDGDNIIGVC